MDPKHDDGAPGPGAAPAVPAVGAPLLEIRDLDVEFTTQQGTVQAVEGASLTLPAGGTLAIVGESGSGKSTTAMAAIGLLPGNGRVTAGSVRFAGEELVGLPESRMRRIRGRRIGLVPQDPMSNLNPVTRVGQQIGETLLTHGMATKKDVGAAVVEVMERAGIPEPARRAKQYPHELSGGLRQRVLIAIGLACRPQLLIADEPTSALDVTVQQVILDQIDEMTRELGSSVLLITHDLGLAAERASHLVVMYKGRVVESGPALEILQDPQHEYTKRLVAAAPSLSAHRDEASAVSGVREVEAETLHDEVQDDLEDRRVAQQSSYDAEDDDAQESQQASVEESAPLVNYVSYEAQSLTADWQRFMRREMDADQFRSLVKRIDQYLKRSMNDGSLLSQNLSEIMLAQDFQDLTGQVIKRVTRLITELESNLLNLVLMAGQVDRVAGIQHDRDAMRAEQEKKKQEKSPSNGEGPQMHADKREDVVSGQDDVDDLLSSLGF